jgi:hypothetical protein
VAVAQSGADAYRRWAATVSVFLAAAWIVIGLVMKW